MESKSRLSNSDDKPVPTPSLKKLILTTFTSTTLRLALPSISGTILGVTLDNIFSTKPFGTILGVIIGVIIAIMLVYKQIKTVNSVNNK